jgi:hypothetical protein
MPKPTTIQQFRAEITTAKERPTIERTALAAYAPAPVPILPDVAAHIHTRMEIEQTAAALAEFDAYPVENRELTAVQNCLEENAPGMVTAWSETIKARSAKLPGVLANYGKKFEALKAAFESGDTREANRKKRDAIEEEVETLEESIQTAKTAVRSFELMPTLEAFESADALVNKITLPNS